MTSTAHKAVFSDQDLEDLKDAVGTEITAASGEGGAWYTLFATGKVEAMIQRLEVAELVCYAILRGHSKADVERALRTWRRVSGNDL